MANKAKEFNPHRENAAIPPTILTIFGATGDLSADYLLPALLLLDQQRLLPASFRLICVGRRDFGTREFFEFILDKSKVLRRRFSKKAREHFFWHVAYYRADFGDPASFRGLEKLMRDQEAPKHKCYNRLYYFATSPQYFSAIAKILKTAGLLRSCKDHQRQTRVLVEKPFGFNYRSARALNGLLLKYFTEDQIYRIDHYQGKETVQNLMVVRFANTLFEPLWNKDFIDHVEISVFEEDRAGSRAAYYDQTGALKDMVQNHMLQLLSLIAMDEPKELTAEYIRSEKEKVLKALRPITPSKLGSQVLRGQYQDYAKEVGKESGTETYAIVKAFVGLPRWQNVPFYLRTGKATHKKLAEISVHYKELPRCLFKNCASNILTFRIQPDESVSLRVNNKVPGFGVALHQGLLDFSYQRAFKGALPPAYERLLLDFLQGDQRLFIRSDEIEAAWKFIDSISENWDAAGLPLYRYKPGSVGPKEAEDFMAKDLKEWWTK
jgi:glucose-6-phosphate 1-dehydrogenase